MVDLEKKLDQHASLDIDLEVAVRAQAMWKEVEHSPTYPSVVKLVRTRSSSLESDKPSPAPFLEVACQRNPLSFWNDRGFVEKLARSYGLLEQCRLKSSTLPRIASLIQQETKLDISRRKIEDDLLCDAFGPDCIASLAEFETQVTNYDSYLGDLNREINAYRRLLASLPPLASPMDAIDSLCGGNKEIAALHHQYESLLISAAAFQDTIVRSLSDIHAITKLPRSLEADLSRFESDLASFWSSLEHNDSISPMELQLVLEQLGRTHSCPEWG